VLQDRDRSCLEKGEKLPTQEEIWKINTTVRDWSLNDEFRLIGAVREKRGITEADMGEKNVVYAFGTCWGPNKRGVKSGCGKGGGVPCDGKYEEREKPRLRNFDWLNRRKTPRGQGTHNYVPVKR